MNPGWVSVSTAAAFRCPALADTVVVRENEPVFYRPIRIGVDVCLKCHGDAESLAPEVSDRLAELYPDDRATGFAMGDLRGAFVVERMVTGP